MNRPFALKTSLNRFVNFILFNIFTTVNVETLFDITSNILSSLKTILETYKPDLVFVHGDTTTAFISSLACFYLKIKIAHNTAIRGTLCA